MGLIFLNLETYLEKKIILLIKGRANTRNQGLVYPILLQLEVTLLLHPESTETQTLEILMTGLLASKKRILWVLNSQVL
jgi:hypothetical protein